MVELHSSYFYHIRYFKPYMIPLSTTVYDPKWYHNDRDQSYRFLDKNGVINGLKITPLVPGHTCADLCRGSLMCNIEEGPGTCAFMRNYKEQLGKINVPEFLNTVDAYVREVASTMNLDREPIGVFMFHEVPTNWCSERWAVREWLEENGFKLTELMYPIPEYY